MSEFRRVKVEEVGDVTVVRFNEHRFIDALEIEKLGQELYQLVEGGKRRKMLLDFSTIELFSSAAFGKLISLNGKIRSNSGALRLCNVRAPILNTFHICKLDQLFDIRKDEADALTAFSE